MKIISHKNLSSAVTVLKNNGVITYPTDTAYALGGIFNSQKVKNRILKIKGRKDDKFTLIASDAAQVSQYFRLPPRGKALAKKYWPGPLSLVVSPRFAVRVPANTLARTLARRVGCPLIATSANLTGGRTLYSGLAVMKEFQNRKNQPDLILDAGRLKKIKTSTIVQVKKGKVAVLRSGALDLRQEL